jgi:hypothetical protein
MYPYQPPTKPPLPVAELTTLSDLILGGTLNTAEDVRCVEVVQLYAFASLFPLPQTTVAGGVKPLAVISHAEAANQLKSLATNPSAAINWWPILSIVLTLLQQFVQSQGH